MIWKSEHISTAAKRAQELIKAKISTPSVARQQAGDAARCIGIVGAGPKGLYALERLLHEFHQSPPADPVHIYWLNESTDFGSGNNYRVDQLDYLLINYCIGNIDAWDRLLPNNRIDGQLTLTDWIAKCRAENTPGPAPTDYASRALVGRYLQDVTMSVVNDLPANATVSLLCNSVTDIDYHDGMFSLSLGGETGQLKMDYLLLATGHCYENRSLIERDDAIPTGRYFKTAYPVERLGQIPAGATVGIAGMGLTFIDAALQLSEGRGGKFSENGGYIASGNEPVLYAFSRGNLPIVARGPIYGDARYRLREDTIEKLQQLSEVSKLRQLDFRLEVYPLLQAEAQYAYYSTKLHTRDIQLINRHIDAQDPSTLFTLDTLLFAKAMQDDWTQDHIVDYLKMTATAASLGELHSPLLAASAVWREAMPLVGMLYQHAGFTGDSQQFLDKELLGAFCRTSYGPPVENIYKILALVEKGIIQFPAIENASIQYDEDNSHFSMQGGVSGCCFSYLIDARIARSDIATGNAPLYRALLRNSLVAAYENDGYKTGGIAMDARGRSLGDDGNAHPPLYFYGTPTEGVLLDNDSLSRKCNDLASSWARQMVLFVQKTHAL